MSTTTAPNYVSSAFYSQYNLILLGGSALFSLAAASPLPLAVGVAVELAWLALGPRLPVFRRHVERRADGERRAHLDDEVLRGMRGLDPAHSSRLMALSQDISWILLRAEPHATTVHERAALFELERLRQTFLQLCALRERLGQRLDELRRSPPDREVALLSQQYAAEKDLGVRFTLHQAIKLAQRKIEQQGRYVELGRQLDLKLSNIEQALAQLRHQQQLGTGSNDLPREIQGVLSHASGLQAFEAELEAGQELFQER